MARVDIERVYNLRTEDMAERTWSLGRVFANVLATSARGLWAGKAPGAGIPQAPQLAFAGLQLQQPSDTKSLWQVGICGGLYGWLHAHLHEGYMRIWMKSTC